MPALPGSRTCASTTSIRGDLARTSSRSNGRKSHTARTPCGVVVSPAFARSSSPISTPDMPAAAARPPKSGWRSRKLRVHHRRRTTTAGRPGSPASAAPRSASRTACGPSTTNRDRSVRNARSASRRASRRPATPSSRRELVSELAIAGIASPAQRPGVRLLIPCVVRLQPAPWAALPWRSSPARGRRPRR